jgi:hypothetical protein
VVGGSKVQQARRGLIAAGFGAPLSAAAAAPGSCQRSTPEEQCAHLAEIARYIDDFRPLLGEGGWQTSGVAVDFDCAEAHAVAHLRQVEARLKKTMSQ